MASKKPAKKTAKTGNARKKAAGVPAGGTTAAAGKKSAETFVEDDTVIEADEDLAEDLDETETDEAEETVDEPADAESPATRGERLRSQPVEVQEIDVQIARERRSRLTPFTPRSFGPKPKKPKPAEIVDTLVKYMGKAPPLPDRTQLDSVAELCLYCIFALGGNPAKVALDATRRLVTTFPEWNEFRVSEAYEFLEALEGLPVVEPYDRCEQVLEFVNEIYQDQNAVDLEFLRELSPDDRLVALNRYRSLGPAASHYIALSLQGFEGVLFHFSWARAIQRVGVVARSGSPKALVASLGKVFQGLDVVSLQVNLIDLGETICQSKSPQCRTCYLVTMCRSRKV